MLCRGLSPGCTVCSRPLPSQWPYFWQSHIPVLRTTTFLSELCIGKPHLGRLQVYSHPCQVALFAKRYFTGWYWRIAVGVIRRRPKRQVLGCTQCGLVVCHQRSHVGMCACRLAHFQKLFAVIERWSMVENLFFNTLL